MLSANFDPHEKQIWEIEEKTELVQSGFKGYHYEIFNIYTLEELDYVWNLGENKAQIIELSNRNF